MKRRTFLKSLSAAGAAATVAPVGAMAQGAGLNLKITDVKLRKIRLVRELGSTPQYHPGRPAISRVGGQTFVEIRTNQGLVGIGPGVAPGTIADAAQLLVGQDPFLIDGHAYELFRLAGGANVEIALWDLIGKAVNLPLYKLWGGSHGTLMPYASQHSVGTPEERARMAQTVSHDGWRAIKFRGHNQTLKEDIALVELTRKALGPGFHIMVDANQTGAYPDGWAGGPVRLDLTRALQMAKEYDRLGVFFLEEPQPRWAFEELSIITASVPMMIAGGEGSRGIHEWRWYMEQKCLDVLQFDVGVVGPAVSRQVAALAASHHRSCVGHVSDGLGQICTGHLLAAWPNSLAFNDDYPNIPTWEIYYEPPAADTMQMYEVFERPPVMNKMAGTITLSEAPGLGVSYKADLIQEV
jgi:L-alanine-DL-glutamate epimerase-like enolase superfamily enzyme